MARVLPCVCVLHPADTLREYNEWAELHTAWIPPRNRTAPSKDILGFFMGFRKDQPISDYTDNILLRGGRNLHQGSCRVRASLPADCAATDLQRPPRDCAVVRLLCQSNFCSTFGGCEHTCAWTRSSTTTRAPH
jgi:hypothetical protein